MISTVASSSFWWLEADHNKWTSALYIQIYLCQLAAYHHISHDNTSLSASLLSPYLKAPLPAASLLSSFPPLSAIQQALIYTDIEECRMAASSLGLSSSSSSSASASPMASLSASSYYTALLYDSLSSVPYIAPSTPMNPATLYNTVALRHARIVKGKLILHLPDAQLVPHIIDRHHVKEAAAAAADASVIRSASASVYEYEPVISALMSDEMFEESEFAPSPIPRDDGGDVHLLCGLRWWSNSTQWPIPSAYASSSSSAHMDSSTNVVTDDNDDDDDDDDTGPIPFSAYKQSMSCYTIGLYSTISWSLIIS